MRGAPGVLAHELQRRWRREHYVGTLLDVGVPVVNEVARAWDHDEGAFRALAAAWLELNRTAVSRSLRTVGEQA
jgi:hypothetical protein